jgi:DNA-binding NtrC family response regulator
MEPRNISILVAEDEEPILEQYQTLLEKKYSSVFTAQNKKEASNIFQKSLDKGVQIPVVVTDIQMESDTAGIDLINEVCSLQPMTQFIIVSALHERAFVAIQTAKANIASLPKPVSFMHLRLAIEAALERYKEFQWLEKLKRTLSEGV